MDISQENVEEDNKYAFLLGSALRNEDPEQLLTVYDNLIPEHLSADRLTNIKEEARKISELSDDEFSGLVLNARTYSLAPGRSSMSQASGRSPAPLTEADNDDLVTCVSKRDGISSNHYVHTHSSVRRSCSPLASKPHLNPPDSLDLAGASADEDSGLPDSSFKASSFKNSCSDSTNGDSEGEPAGVFDYMPSSRASVRISQTYNPPYDEAINVDSSTGGSSVESPRSETSVTHDEYNLMGGEGEENEGEEMQQFSFKETPISVSEHESLYGRSRYLERQCWDYTPSRGAVEEEDIDDDDDDRYRYSRHESTPFMSELRTSRTQVDAGISYGLPRYGSTDREGSYDASTSARVMSRSYNMCQEELSRDGKEKKKDKKKSRSKDDSDKPEHTGILDVNGNPSPIDTSAYPQMRHLPGSKSESATSGSLAGQPSSQSGNDQTKELERKLQRRRENKEKNKGTPAQNCKDYKGYSDIDTILSYVEGDNSHKKNKEKDIGTPDSASKADGKSAKKKPERGKKKEQHLNGPVALEDKISGEGSASPGKEVTVVTATDKPGQVAMGNNPTKSAAENDIISKPGVPDEDLDKSSNEFHDCLNTPPEELVISDKEQTLHSNKTVNHKKLANSPSEADKIDLSTKPDNNSGDKNSVDNNKTVNNKKPSKTKGKKEKPEVISENGPLSPKANMVKPKDLSEIPNSVPVSESQAKDYSAEFDGALDSEQQELKPEGTFQVVRKKKRTGGKDMHPAANNVSTSSTPYYSQNANGLSYRGNQRHRPSTPPPPTTMATTATVNSSNSLPVAEQTHSPRDLSPSSFPVLLSHCPVGARPEGGRRNSCGDISTEAVDSKTYDSDRESAKSLPDAHGARAGGEISPVYPVSYAMIAAAPRKYENTNSPSSESSGVATGSQTSSVNSSVAHTPGSSIDITSPQTPPNAATTPERKTVWKGSPRERRHSIGSSPEDKVETEKSSITQRNRQCGSQEVLSRDIIMSSIASSREGVTSVTSAPVKALHASESSNSLQSDPDFMEETGQSVVPRIVPSQPKGIVTSAQASAKMAASVTAPKLPATVMATSAQVASTVSSTRVTGTLNNVPSQPRPTQQPSQTPAASVTKDKVGLEPSATIVPVPDPIKAKKAVTAQAGSNTSDSSTKTVPAAPTKNKLVSPGPDTARKSSGSTNNTKSVIFLDKRFGSSPPQNLGITFGFDSSYESPSSDPASQPTSQQQQPQPSLLPSQPQLIATVPSLLAQNPAVSSQVQPTPPSPAAPHGSHHIPSVAAPATTVSSDMPISTTSSSQSNDNINNSQVPKGPHIPGPRNGLILPSNPVVNSVAQQAQAANISVNKSISSNISNSATSIASSTRTSTSSSTLKQEASSGPDSNSSVIKPSGCLVLPGLPNPSPAALANSPLAQLTKSTAHIVTGNNKVTIMPANPTGLTYSPNHPPPPIPQGVMSMAGDKNAIASSTSASTSSPASLQKTREATPENQVVPKSSTPARSSASTPANTPAPSAKVVAAPEAVDTPAAATSSAPTVPQSSTKAATAAQQQHPLVPPEVLNTAIPVVYGLKLKPDGGCGKLMFIPADNLTKRKPNSTEIRNFLTKQWSKVSSPDKGSPTYVTITDTKN